MRKLILLLVAAVCLFASCEKNVLVENPVQESKDKLLTGNIISGIICGTEAIVDFLAGQHHLAGNIIVGNDAENLYVTFTTINGWMLKATHLYAGSCELIPVNKAKNPVIGRFPYKADHPSYVTSFIYAIPLSALPECICIAAHAEVVEVNDNNEIIQEESAWGDGEEIGGKSWAMKFDYCKQVCDPSDPTVYHNETAWVTGIRYARKYSRATYYPYEGKMNDVPIFAGEDIYVGAASFSGVEDGYVNVSFRLIDKWELQLVVDAVKVQGYEYPPVGTPDPHQFETYKGTDLTIQIPAYEFYGIQMDVRKLID